MDIQEDPCECGAHPLPGTVLMGWRPCRCGGHRTRYCRDDRGGCGTTLLDPPSAGWRCRAPGWGPEAIPVPVPHSHPIDLRR